ncbi:MAG: response regulator [Sulfitobacter sp.]
MHQSSYASDQQPIRQSIKTLLLDDNNFDRQRIRRMSLKTDLPIEIDEVDSIETMKQAVKAVSYDLVLIDYRLPVGDGLTALDAIHSGALNKDPGTIMITGESKVETAVSAMKRGCHEFLAKDDMNTDALRAAMMNAMVLAGHNRIPILPEATQSAQIRDVVADALSDPEMQGTLVSILKGHLRNAGSLPSDMSPGSDPDEMSQMVEALLRNDEFQFLLN